MIRGWHSDGQPCYEQACALEHRPPPASEYETRPAPPLEMIEASPDDMARLSLDMSGVRPAALPRRSGGHGRARQVLAVPVQDVDIDGVETIRDYLATLLRRLWEERQDFNSKRPFGSSGWHLDLDLALVRAGLVEGSLDEDGYLATSDSAAADALISEAIDYLVSER